MQIGDLVRVKDCKDPVHEDFACSCFLCSGRSNRIGVVLGPAPRNYWHVMFDWGDGSIDDFDVARGDVEILNENR